MQFAFRMCSHKDSRKRIINSCGKRNILLCCQSHLRPDKHVFHNPPKKRNYLLNNGFRHSPEPLLRSLPAARVIAEGNPRSKPQGVRATSTICPSYNSGQLPTMGGFLEYSSNDHRVWRRRREERPLVWIEGGRRSEPDGWSHAADRSPCGWTTLWGGYTLGKRGEKLAGFPRRRARAWKPGAVFHSATTVVDWRQRRLLSLFHISPGLMR
jgi:hypothetical protein